MSFHFRWYFLSVWALCMHVKLANTTESIRNLWIWILLFSPLNIIFRCFPISIDFYKKVYWCNKPLRCWFYESGKLENKITYSTRFRLLNILQRHVHVCLVHVCRNDCKQAYLTLMGVVKLQLPCLQQVASFPSPLVHAWTHIHTQLSAPPRPLPMLFPLSGGPFPHFYLFKFFIFPKPSSKSLLKNHYVNKVRASFR